MRVFPVWAFIERIGDARPGWMQDSGRVEDFVGWGGKAGFSKPTGIGGGGFLGGWEEGVDSGGLLEDITTSVHKHKHKRKHKNNHSIQLKKKKRSQSYIYNIKKII